MWKLETVRFGDSVTETAPRLRLERSGLPILRLKRSRDQAWALFSKELCRVRIVGSVTKYFEVQYDAESLERLS